MEQQELISYKVTCGDRPPSKPDENGPAKELQRNVVFNENFQYVVQRNRKTKISFGSCQERQACRVLSRFGAEFTPTDSTPGNYFVLSSMIQRKPESKKGTVLGGRTSVRLQPIPNAEYPTPASYSIRDQLTTPEYTFSARTPRFEDGKKNRIVGPGFYKVHTVTQRKPKYIHSFGGKMRLVPAIEMKCGPINPDTCEICKSTPKGDYWYIIEKVASNEKAFETRTAYLCRSCYDKEKKSPKLYKTAKLLLFKKVRDCSQVHFHDGCEARLLLVPPRDIEKIQEKEAYLSLYFM